MQPDKNIVVQLGVSMACNWTRWSHSYGPLLGAWIGLPEPPLRRLRLLVETVLAASLRSVSSDLTATLDYPRDHDVGPPTAIVIANADDALVIPVKLTSRTITIGNKTIGLMSRHCGDGIVDALSLRAGAWLSQPA